MAKLFMCTPKASLSVYLTEKGKLLLRPHTAVMILVLGAGSPLCMLLKPDFHEHPSLLAIYSDTNLC